MNNTTGKNTAVNNTTANDTMGDFVLITRPKEDAVEVEKHLTQRGIKSLSTPLLSIEYIDPVEPISKWLKSSQALVLTSANGVRALMRQKQHHNDMLKLPLYAVGDATAREAELSGFQSIETASGDVDKLAELITKNLLPKNGPLLHIAGSKVAGDLSGLLMDKSFVLHRAVCYNSKQATELSIDTIEALAHARVRVVLFYSPRTAESFSNLVEKAKLSQTLSTVNAICLSPNVATKIDHLPWRKISIADQPTQADLLTQLDKIMADTNTSEAQNSSDISLENYTAEDIIEAFGGIRPMAHKLDIAVSTVQGWKSRNHIPDGKLDDVAKALVSEGIKLPEPTMETKPADEKVSVTIEMEPAKEENTSEINDVAPPSPKKISFFSLIGIPTLAVAILFQPYWGPAVEKKLTPFVSKFAPNLAAIKSQNGQDSADSQQVDLGPIQSRLATIETELNKIPNVADAALISLQDQITKLTGMVNELQSDLNARPIIRESADGTTIDLSPLQLQLDQLKTELSAFNQVQDSTRASVEQQISPLLEKLNQQQSEIENLAQQRIPASNNATSVALLISVMEISEALQQGRSIGDFLPRLKSISAGNDDLSQASENLTILAESKIPTFHQLQQDFATMAANPDAQKVDATSDEWIDATLNNLQGLISIRRVGDGEELPPISQAEIALSRYNLNEAIRVLTPLKSERSDVNDWLYMANKLNRAELNLTRIRHAASEMLLAGGDS